MRFLDRFDLAKFLLALQDLDDDPDPAAPAGFGPVTPVFFERDAKDEGTLKDCGLADEVKPFLPCMMSEPAGVDGMDGASELESDWLPETETETERMAALDTDTETLLISL